MGNMYSSLTNQIDHTFYVLMTKQFNFCIDFLKNFHCHGFAIRLESRRSHPKCFTVWYCLIGLNNKLSSHFAQS